MIALQETYSNLMNQREGLIAEQDLKMKEIRSLEDSIAEMNKNSEKELSIIEAHYNDLKDDVGESASFFMTGCEPGANAIVTVSFLQQPMRLSE